MYIKFVKRVFDMTIVILSLLAFTPLIVIIVLLIKVFDPGPLIFKQVRVGKNAKRFNFYKFRSMPLGTGDIPSDKLGNVKLTVIGKFIRRTNLDEIPQLFNVVKGDMSIVGPRPCLPSQTDLILLREKNGAIHCLPGLTGLAQINAFDGMSINEKADFDGEYQKNISFVNDVRVIIGTLSYLLKPPPVY